MEYTSYDLKKIYEIAREDEVFIREMLVTFVENVALDIKKIKSFRAAENWTAIAESAHKLASNFAYLGADELKDLSYSIEKSVIIDRNLIGIADKSDKLCSESILLVNQLKSDFNIAYTN